MIRDTRMMAKCLVQRWPITQEQRRQIIDCLMEVVSDPTVSTRELLSAAKALIACEGQNQKDDHAARYLPPQSESRYLQIAANLGIDVHKLTNGTPPIPSTKE